MKIKSALLNLSKRVVQKTGNIAQADVEKNVRHLTRLIGYDPQPIRKTTKSFNPSQMKITWVIPDFVAGGGGHMNIFRCSSLLEQFGHEVKILIQNPLHHTNGNEALATINKYYQPFSGEVELFTSELPVTTGDALIATDRFTCYPVNAMSGYKRKFYFVQDYETLFYPAGSEALLTEATYSFDFDCLCGGEWLHDLMSNKFNRWSMAWPFAYDSQFYSVDPEFDRSTNRIAFYARFVTPRRAVELGLLALNILMERGLDFEVDFFGWDIGSLNVGYNHVNHGILNAETLSKIYRQATIGLVFSATNHSLINKEMMACGLPVVDLDIDSVRSIFPSDCMAFAIPTPVGIADTIQSILDNREKQDKLRRNGLRFVDGLSWESSARLVENAIRERVSNAQMSG